jgi:hypothetical protein
MLFNEYYKLITESASRIYKTTYQSDKWGGDTVVGLTIEFLDLDKDIDSDTGNVIWDWELLLDDKRKVSYFMHVGGGVADPGCYFIEKDEYGHEVLGEQNKDYEEVDEIREYLKKEWPVEKREEYIRKKKFEERGLTSDQATAAARI